MACQTASTIRLLPCLKKVLPFRSTHDCMLRHVRISPVFCKLSWNHFHMSSTRPQRFLEFGAARRSSQLLNFNKQCSCSEERKWSSVALHIPQVDLESEDKTNLSSEPEVCASEVLQNLSAEETRKLKIIKLEFDVTEQMYGKVPEEMTDENWLHALRLTSKSQRLRYYRFLMKIEKTKKSKQKKQQLKQQQTVETVVKSEEVVSKNTIFFTIRDSAVKKVGNYRLAYAMQFGQPLVFDMDYEQYMRREDCQNLVFQLQLSYSKNRDDMDPFHFVFTSLDAHSKALKMLRQAKLTGSNFMGTMTDKSYLDLFPRERLVYLSPHAKQCLTEVNADDVYIVGGIVDKTYTKPLSLARAKEQGIRVAKFPLDDYLLWGCGSKSLTLDQVTSILLEQKKSKDWNQAFKVIPERKLHREDS